MKEKIKCDKCQFRKRYRTGADEYPAYTTIEYCSKGHWEGGDIPSAEDIDNWSNCSESAFTEVYLKNHGWQKLLSQGEIGNHEGLSGIYYLVDGFGKVHEKYCKHFR